MTYLRRNACFIFALLLLFCSACSPANETVEHTSGGKSEGIQEDIEGVVQENEVDYEEIAFSSMEEMLKARLRNPESLQIHDIRLDGDEYDGEQDYYCTVLVDYSAQNGFGGYNREEAKGYFVISKADGSVTELDEGAYRNHRVAAEFGDGLCEISVDIPMEYLCSGDSYNLLLAEMEQSSRKYKSSTSKDGEVEIDHVAKIGNLEGFATFFYPSKTVPVYQIEFFWTNGFAYYTGKDVLTLSPEYMATLEDVNALMERVDSALKLSHSEIVETTEPRFHDYECRWDLADGIYGKLSWTVNDDDGSIGHIRLIFCNETNGLEE